MTLQSQLQEGALAEAPGEKALFARLWRGVPEARVQEILDVYPKPYRPSGGEKQRILAAMAFKKMATIEAPVPGSLFIFDEPTGNLDNALRDEFLDLLIEGYRKCRATILLITHDYSIISLFSAKYSNLAKQFHYKELLLDRGKLRLKEFLPSSYLNWIGGRRAHAKSSQRTEIVARLAPVIRVFGRTLTVSSAGEGNRPEPLVIRRGSMVYLKAPSGGGKTTVVKLMMGLLTAEQFSMELAGMSFTEKTGRRMWSRHVWGRQMAMVFQHADEALNQNSIVKDVFAGLPLRTPLDAAAIVQKLSELFEEQLTNEFLQKPVRFLSGGQKQRLNLLRSMVLDTDILILDEPLNGLDFESSVKVLDHIENRLQRGKSVLVISHNEEIFDAVTSPGDVYYLHQVPEKPR